MKKRLFAIMLALTMLLAAVPALAEEGGEAPESTKKICRNCKAKVDNVNEQGLCENCVSNLKQNDTQQTMVTSFKTLSVDNTEGGTNGGNAGDKTDGSTGDNPGENSNTDNSGSIDGNTSTTEGQNPSTSDGEGGGEQPANPTQPTCDHKNVRYEQYATKEEGRFTHHKKVCEDCGKELVKESHQWDETTKKPKTEGNNIPTCTNGGDWTVQCGLCDHVTVFKGSALGHDYGDPTWNWCGVSSATATFKCKRNCGEKNAMVTCQVRPTRSSINNCGYYTYTATVEFNDKTYTNTRTDYSCRPDWYYDPCYYNNPCGHWGCGNVCTRYSNCVPCQNYRTTFRVGGYNCLATPKTGDVSVIGMALISLAGAGAAIMGKKRR